MAKFEFEYTEIDGLLYLNIEIDGKGELDKLGKYGRIRPNYLNVHPMPEKDTMERIRLSDIDRGSACSF
ncbi:hypothetical protein [Alkaliphilus sp. B6464]|uniref:hypothetical protein n=1 Tax=Alkaliphilus sp. B6464 TaxID=2731219 RepID=UPI001BA5E64F|nr:hypothetical protein [Alkaliphilus sp. B6464]QUH19578.1 hypothetical protein HYG84_06520 [Alkaliphilus sp. B6464]